MSQKEFVLGLIETELDREQAERERQIDTESPTEDTYEEGNVPFQCKHFLGYTKNADGEIEIVPEEAEIIREIYERYLSGESLHGIKCYLEAKEIPTPAGCSVWRQETIRSILSNEKYKGDAIINKTYVSDCISKRIKANNGERNKYYIENNHPAIIDAGTFARVQEEIARRSGKPKVKQKGTKTELSRYSSKSDNRGAFRSSCYRAE